MVLQMDLTIGSMSETVAYNPSFLKDLSAVLDILEI
jgi:hypothetical protein